MLISDWLIEGWEVPVFSPITFELSVTVQEYLVPVGTIFPFVFVGVYVKVSSEQIPKFVFAISGVGFTVTVTLNVPPEQEDATIGVTVYSTV